MDSSEIKNLLHEYLEKGESVEQAKNNLKSMGYSDGDINGAVAALNLSVQSEMSPPSLNLENNPEWAKAGNDILNEKRHDIRSKAWGAVVIFGGLAGFRSYFLFWQTKQTFDKACQTTNFPYQQTNSCYQNKVDSTKVIIATLVGVTIAVVITKICYVVADSIRNKNSKTS